ncbi:hypothetical protein L484_011204 [Morus notabilis]|uniref:Uncharacterized protein n=1 Tax=Morus notabilis TaxID=981085 RepID=W9SAN2_9ROSA|nr:hypothetical protein L484_011204 [Morus notabilis]
MKCFSNANKTSCGNSHKAKIGTELGPWLCATLRRFDSTTDETAMESTIIVWPALIGWRSVGARPVSFRHMGYMRRSTSGKDIELDIKTSTWKDSAGILKCEPRRRSMVRARRTVKLPWIAIGVLTNKLDDHSGKF